MGRWLWGMMMEKGGFDKLEKLYNLLRLLEYIRWLE